jgi:hypothetical protein
LPFIAWKCLIFPAAGLRLKAHKLPFFA